MADYTKTQGTSLLSHQAVTHPDTVKGSATDVSSKMAATIFLFHAFIEDAANTNPGSFHIQASASSSGDEDWATIVQFTARAATATELDSEAPTGSESIGATVIEVASTTGFVAGDVIYFQDTGTAADSEWCRVQEIVTNTSVNLVDGITNAKDTGDLLWNYAEIFVAQLDLAAIGRIRVIFQHEGATGANVHVKAMMVTADALE